MAALRQWRIPFLNEFIFGTVPHLGNHAVGVLYPPRLIALLFGSSLGHGLIVVGHMLMLGLGMVALARRFGLSSLGGAIAGVVVVLIGSTQTKTVQFEQIQPLAWLPLLLLALHGCVTARRGWRKVGVLAIVATGTLLSGHPQLILEVVFVAALFTIGLIVRYRTGLVRLGVAAGLSVAMALPQLLATLDARSVASLDEGRSFTDLSNGMYILQVRKAAQALFGTITGGDPAAFSGAFEAIGWFGVAGVIVGAIGMVAALKSSSDRWWSLPLAATIILGLIWSLGPRTPVFTIAYRLIPGFDLGQSVRWLRCRHCPCALRWCRRRRCEIAVIASDFTNTRLSNRARSDRHWVRPDHFGLPARRGDLAAHRCARSYCSSRRSTSPRRSSSRVRGCC